MKRLFNLLMSLMVLLSITACSGEDYYRYADNWDDSSIEIPLTNGIAVDEERDERLESILNDCKDMISLSNLKQLYPKFNWQEFEEVTILKSSGALKFEEIITTGIDARYQKDVNKIYVFPVCDEYTTEYLMTILLHELIHTITATDHSMSNVLFEGIADYYACQISNDFNLPFKFKYVEEVYALQFLVDIFGEKETMHMIYNGKLNQKIDEFSKAGMANKFQNALMIYANYYEFFGKVDEQARMELFQVYMDILCHAAVNYSKELPKKEKNNILGNCKFMVDSISSEFNHEAYSYFRNLLDD